MTTFNPLGLLSDDQLYSTMLSLALACGRSHSALKKKHRERICFMFDLLAIESNQRDKPIPVPPYKA